MPQTYKANGKTFRVVDLFEAVKFMSSRFIEPGSQEAGSQTQSVRFVDGAIVTAMSNCAGPYSEVTPDLEFSPPTFHIHDPKWDEV